MESSRQENKVVRSKKAQIKALRNNIEALLFHLILVIILISSLNVGLKCIGYDLLAKLPESVGSIVNYSIGVSALIFGYWYMNKRILLGNAN